MNSNTNKDDDRAYSVNRLLEPLRQYFENPDVTELRLKRPDRVVVQGFFGKRVEEIDFPHSKLQNLGVALATYNNVPENSINYVVLPAGQRGTMFRYPAVTTDHYQFVFRKHVAETLPMDTLEEQGVFSSWKDVAFNQPTEAEIAAQCARNDAMRMHEDDAELLRLKASGNLRAFIERAILLRKNIVVSGATGSGKTTFIRSCIQVIPKDEHIVTLEDVHEMPLPEFEEATHILFGNGPGRVPAKKGMELCMRITPDRIFPAELRGDEAWDYLKALGNGHPGSITTTHANGAFEAYSRMTMLIKESDVGKGMDIETIKRALYSTVNIVIHLKRRQIQQVFFDPIWAQQFLA